MEKETENMSSDISEPVSEPVYEPAGVARPWWRISGARILLVIFLLFVIAYYVNIARGGR